MKIAFMGLGAMGSGMARRLMTAGHQMQVWNRSPAPAEQLEREGATRLVNPQDAFQSEAVVTMLADDAALRSAFLDSGALERAATGVVHIVCATISVSLAKELTEAHRVAGVEYVAAPVLGRPDVAATGELNILAAGAARSVERARPVLEAIGRKIWLIGDEPYKANLAKLAVNFMLASMLETMGEVFALAHRHDVDAEALREVITNTLFAAPAYKLYAPVIAARKFEPAGFKLPLGLKDVRLVIAAGEEAGVPLPFASVLHDNFIDALGHGDGGKDWSAIADVAWRRAGLDR
jgi:3-hydroxyisobutyrate dehydrogenase-like beta-hydroxyacid dehydrogenase